VVTIDASVLVAADTADESAHDDCAAFLRALIQDGIAVHQPSLSVVEITAAVARRTRDTALARDAGSALLGMPGVVFHDLSLDQASKAAALAVSWFLRGADAIYASIAAATGSTLVTLDDELLARAPAGVVVTTPARWLSSRG
jgi:predicted nucleic acid-binding protein